MSDGPTNSVSDGPTNNVLMSKLNDLDIAVGRLADRVAALADALSTINHLDAAQQDINRQLPEALAAAHQALAEQRTLRQQVASDRAQVEKLALEVIPKEEREQIELLTKNAHRMVRNWVVIPASLTMIGGLIAVVLLLASQHRTLHRLTVDENISKLQSYTSCVARNESVLQQQRNSALTVPLLHDIEAALPDSSAKTRAEADITQVLITLTKQEQVATVDCSGFLKKG